MKYRKPVTVKNITKGTWSILGYYAGSMQPFVLRCPFSELDERLYQLGLVAV